MVNKPKSMILGWSFLLVVLVVLCPLHLNPTLVERRTFAKAGSFSIQSGPTASFKWSMPERFGEKNKTGIVEYHWDRVTRTYDKTYVNPASWKVDFNACDSSGGGTTIDTYALEIGGQLIPEGSDCRFTHEFPALGSYPVRLIVTAKDGQTASTQENLVIRDYLIVSIGDSFASGEGNPDIRAGKLHKLNFSGAVWEDDLTHRSANAGPAQAALSIEQADSHTSVTFISFACSGASLEYGLTGGQTRGTVILAPQVEKVVDAVNGKRSIDALLISIGGNDVSFAKLVENAIKPGCSDDIDPNNLVRAGLEKLPERFEKLNEMIKGISPLPKVFMTEYPDIVHDESGEFCDRRPTFDLMRGICTNEAESAFKDVITPLNEAVKAAADKWGWVYVGGIASAFRNHGYCAGDQRWALINRDSLHLQRDIYGTAHPNKGGHAWYATRLIEELQKAGVTTPVGP